MAASNPVSVFSKGTTTMSATSRRGFFQQSLGLGAAALAYGSWRVDAADRKLGSDMAFGLVTYQWGADWDLPTLIANCTKTNVLGVELRTTHAHGVERHLDARQRREVKERFADSPVTLVGLGSAEDYHRPEPGAVERAIENTKEFVKLSHDVGGSGVKVRPNDLPKNVSPEKTIEQIGKALNVVGSFAADYGQQIRLEVHGGCARLPIIKQIMDIATHPNVAVCWNSNAADLQDPGLEHNFHLVKDRLGDTVHVRTFTSPDYPWPTLISLLVKMDYRGWVLLEAGTKVEDRVKALAEQKAMFDAMVARAQE
jgi:sugar phosphate isomerase/epimerase